MLIAPRTDAGELGSGFPKDFSFQISADNAQWHAVAAYVSYPAPKSGEPQVFTFPRQSARYLRINGTSLGTDSSGSFVMQFAEVEIRASLETPPSQVVDFDQLDGRGPIAVWDEGSFQGDCLNGAAATGLSTRASDRAAHSAACASSAATGNTFRGSPPARAPRPCMPFVARRAG